MSGPHDQLSRRTFTLPAEAAAELRLALPAEVVALLDWSTLHIESEIVIDPELEETKKDIVYSIRLLTGQQAYILVLFEHLSTTERWVPLRLLNYVARYLVRWRELHPDSHFLPAIFPVVLYTGAKQEWNAPPRLEELFEGAKHLVTLLAYLAKLQNQRPYKATKQVLYSLVGTQQAEALMKSVAEELTEKARVEERTKVRVETQVEERAASILKILAARDIRVSSRIRQRILSCRDLDTLDRWLTRAARATSAAEVFDKLPQ